MISPSQVGGWGITYSGLDQKRVQAMLDEFHASEGLPTIHKVAIGVQTRSWLTLVGPATSLKRLVEFSPELRLASNIPSDAGVPAHAPFMPGVDAEEVVGHSPLLDRPLDWEKVVMVSPSGDCLPRQFGTLRELLCDIFEDILQRPLPVDKAIESSIAGLPQNAMVSVHEVGITSHMPMVQRTLTAAGLSYDVVPAYRPPPPGSSLTRGMSDLIAVVGMAGRFPGSENIDQFWEELMGGTCHIKKVPKDRFDVDRYYDINQKLKNSTAVKDGAWLDEPGVFDNRFFNVSPREATQMDPVQRLLLTATHEALEMAGYAPGASPSMDPDRVATFIGLTGNDWVQNLHQQGSDIYYVTGAAKAFMSGKINYHYKFGRGSYTMDSVCASSTTALTLACKGLISRDCDMAVSGGASLFSAPFEFSGVGRSGMISLDGGCRTFHDDADGYARGEGIGMVVLKRLEDALADRDNILGVISGSARMYSTTSTSITHPSHTSQEKTYREVLGQTALDPEEIVYVEMHGTGTQAGDYEELTSVLNVMGGQRIVSNPLCVGAVKAAMGHGEGVAGVTALIKTLMMLRHRKIPAQPGWPFKLNHRFPRLDRRNVHIALENTALQASPKSADGRIKMMVNTFDASGGNCSLVVEEAPECHYESHKLSQDVRPSHVVALSARSASSLQRNRENLGGYLERNPDTRLCDLAYTTTARRMHSTLRQAYACTSIEDLKIQLRQQSVDPAKKPVAPRVVFLFTGQGSQYQSMGMGLYSTSTRFREMMNAYQITASHLDLPQFLPIVSGQVDIKTASPVQVQLAILAIELGQAYMLRSWGIVPDAVIGHSLGEYAALCVAGVLSPSDALYLVGRRAQLMEQRLTPDTHAMLAVPMADVELGVRIQKEQQAGRLLSCAVACINSPGATVASGTTADVDVLQSILARENVRSTLLRVPFGFHSAQIEPVLGEFEKIAAGIAFKAPTVPVVSTLTGQVVDTEGVFGPSYLVRQAREPVNFVGALRAVEVITSESASAPLWVEAGPDAVCLGLVRKTLNPDGSCLLPVLTSKKNVWETAAGILKTAYDNGLPVDWKGYHGEFSGSLALLSDLPAYAWDYKNFWTTYTVPPTWEIEEALAASKQGQGVQAERARPVASGFVSTMTLQELVDETLDESAGNVTAIFSSNTGSQGLKTAIEGHVVNGHAIMPLAVFCDMAMTSARHCHARVTSGTTLETTQMTLRDMVIAKAVVLAASSAPVVLTTATYSHATASVNITFHEARDKGNPGPLVGKCCVGISTAAPVTTLTSDLNQTVFLVKTRMEQLRDLAATAKAHHLLRPVVYHLFGDYVQCGKEYLSMDEVIVSAGSQDALASVTAPVAPAANCVLNPYLQDGVNALTGFLLNNTIRSNDDQSIFISEGFSESRQWEPLVPGRKYATYASGQDTDASGSTVDGAAYVFDAETGRLVQMATGVRFQKMKKLTLNHILGVAKPAAAAGSFAFTPAEDRKSRDNQSSVVRPPDTTKSNPAVLVSSLKPLVKANLPAPETVSIQDNALIDRLITIVAAEVGIAPEDMADDILFGDIGIDSLMAITVLSTLRNELDLDLPPTFFMDNESVGTAKQALRMLIFDEDQIESLSTSSASYAGGNDFSAHLTPMLPLDGSEISSVAEEKDEINATWEAVEVPIEVSVTQAQIPSKEKTRPAVAVVEIQEEREDADCRIFHLQGLQEQAHSPSPSVFLLADETGSSAGYVKLPSLGDLCVYGVDWTTNYDINGPDLLSSLADAAAASVISHPAPPPYILGGASFGAVLAVEVARRLPAGECAGMFLLDPPADADEVARTKDLLEKTRVLRPAHGRSIVAAAKAVARYRFEPLDVTMWRSVALVLPENKDGRQRLSEWLPGAEVSLVFGAAAGALLRIPSVSCSPIPFMR